MKNFYKLKPNKELFKKIKWILSHSKPAIPYIFFSTCVSATFSLISLYNVTVSKSLIDSAISGQKDNVIKWLIVMISLTLFSMLSNPLISYLSTHASVRLNQNIQFKIYKHLEYSEWLYLNKHHSVSLLTRITSDVSNISSTLLTLLPSLTSLSVTLLGSFYLLIKWAPAVAITAIFIGPFLILITRLLSKKLKNIYKKSQELDVKYKSFMQESIQNIMIIKTFCMEKNNLDKLQEIQKEKYNLALKNTKLSSLTSLSISFCSNIAYFSIFTWGVLNIAKGVTTYGTFAGMLQLYSKIQAPFSSLAGMVPKLISTIAAAERLMEIEEIPLEDSITIDNTDFKTPPEIEFDNISFGYTSDEYNLNNISFNIEPRETIAFVGPSGEGKTTIIRLILSLINPSHGDILIKSKNEINKINSSHRALMSYVPQGNTLFSGTIEDNLRYGNQSATDDEIKSALKNACALDFIEKLKDGLKTSIGERGVGLSEGQSQRIAIARSFLRKRPILILDEATSALDPETEINILNNIKTLPHNPTCIIITHRPSALDICDSIIKVEKGSITKQFNELKVASNFI